MPCNSDYMNANSKEIAIRETAELFEYLLIEWGEPVPETVKDAVASYYGKIDVTAELCAFLRGLHPVTLAGVLGKKHLMGRRLKEWWKDHSAADKKRERREA